jgi:hypothetical protein
MAKGAMKRIEKGIIGAMDKKTRGAIDNERGNWERIKESAGTA